MSNEFIDEVHCEAVKSFVRYMRVPILLSHVDGRIIWANVEFIRWSKYTLHQLTTNGWRQLSEQGEELDADIAEASRLVTGGFVQTYEVVKKYKPQGDRPKTGTLSVMRWPSVGEFEFAMCVWLPATEYSEQALDEALAVVRSQQEHFKALYTRIEQMCLVSDEQRALEAGMKLIQKNPKMAALIIGFIFANIGLGSLISNMREVGILPKPEVQQLQRIQEQIKTNDREAAARHYIEDSVVYGNHR